MTQIGGVTQIGARGRSGTARASRPRPAARWLAVAAAFLVSVAVPTGIAVQQAQRADRVQLQADAVADVLAQPDAQIVQADVSGGGRAVAVVAADAAVFTAADLPDLDDGDYQLWVVADGAPVSAGSWRSPRGRLWPAWRRCPRGRCSR